MSRPLRRTTASLKRRSGCSISVLCAALPRFSSLKYDTAYDCELDEEVVAVVVEVLYLDISRLYGTFEGMSLIWMSAEASKLENQVLNALLLFCSAR